MKRLQRIVSGVGAMVLLLPVLSRASEANYQQYLLGDRGAGMGGAACAIAEGVEACYYNPAGLARTPNNTLSLSANLYGFQRYKVEDALFPGEDFDADAFQTVPSSAGGTYRMDPNLVLGFAVFAPKKMSYFKTLAFPEAQHYYTLSQDHQVLWLGPSVGWQAQPKLALGASVYGVYSTFNAQQDLYWGDYGRSYAAGYEYSSLSLMGAAGLQYRWNPLWSLGVRAQTPSIMLASEGQVLEHIVGVMNRRLRGELVYADDVEVDNMTAAQFTVGVAREGPGGWTVSADVTCHLEENFTRLKGTDQEGRAFEVPVEREMVVDFGLGAEYLLWKKFPLRAGFFTSRSSAPDPVVNDPYALAKTDLYGFSFSAGTRTKNSAVNLGINYLFGDGTDLGWSLAGDRFEQVLVDVREDYLYFTFNTSYYF